MAATVFTLDCSDLPLYTGLKKSYPMSSVYLFPEGDSKEHS